MEIWMSQQRSEGHVTLRNSVNIPGMQRGVPNFLRPNFCGPDRMGTLNKTKLNFKEINIFLAHLCLEIEIHIHYILRQAPHL